MCSSDLSTVWFGGVPYYYANDVYYIWDSSRNGYVVVEPPANAADTSLPLIRLAAYSAQPVWKIGQPISVRHAISSPVS